MVKRWMIWLVALVFMAILAIPVVSAGGVGGTITSDGQYVVHTFLANGTFNVTAPIANATVLIVAGGGQGGHAASGGGGAGGLIYVTNFNISSNIAIIVGVGGDNRNTGYPAENSFNGTNSILGNRTAIGGGAGGSSTGPYFNGRDGGSGGGAGSAGVNNPGNGTSGQGYKGGYNIYNSNAYPGGGGGGSGQAGLNAVNDATAGGGGNGTYINITGTATWYAGGGGGGNYHTGTSAGLGGLGGGANGGNGANVPQNGTNGLGGGGGGGTGDGAIVGGRGGSGIIIIRYLNSTSAPVGIANVSSVLIAPTTAYGTDNLLCNATASGSNATMSVEWEWLVNNVHYSNGNISVANNTNQLISTLSNIITTPLQNWTCNVRSTPDNVTYSTYLNATRYISMQPMTAPTVTSPTSQVYGGRINVTWTAATSPDGSIYRYNVTFWNTTLISVLANNSASNLSSSFCAKSLPSSASASSCYQETANASNIADGNCNLNYTGRYQTINWIDPQNLTDGNWNTASRWALDSTIFINYTKPFSALSSSTWHIGDGSGSPYNLQIPNECWIAHQNSIELQAVLRGLYNMDYSCWNGTNFINIFTSTKLSLPYNFLAEEAMNWSVSISGHISIEAIDNASQSAIGNSSTFSISYQNHTLASLLTSNITTSSPTILIGCNSTYSPGVVIQGRINISRPGDSLYQYNFTAANGANTYNLSMPNQGKYNYTCEYTSTDCSDGTNVVAPTSILHDSIVPTITIDQPTVGQVIDVSVPSDVRVNYTATDLNRDQCWYILDAGGPTTSAGCANFTLVALSLGSHTISVYANDTTGQTSSDSHQFVLGKMSVLLQTPADGLSTNMGASTLMNFSCNATTFAGNITWMGLTIILPPGSSPVSITDNAYNLNTADSYQLNVSHYLTDEGNYSWYCQANNSGLYTITSLARTLLVDRTAPTITIDNPTEYQTFTLAKQALTQQNIKVNFTANEPISSCSQQYSFQGVPAGSITSCNNQTISLLGGGEVVYTINVTDIAGNSNITTRHFATANMYTTLTDQQGLPLYIVKNGNFSVNLIESPAWMYGANCTATSYVPFVDYISCQPIEWVAPGMQIECSPTYDIQQKINITVSCQYGSYQFSPPAVEIWMDTIAPAFTVASFNLSNQSLMARNLTGTWAIADSNLFRINVTVDGVTLPGMDLQDLNVSYYPFNISYSPSLFPVGKHTLTINAWDSHTAEQIPDYAVSRPLFSNKITYDTASGNRISIAAVADENTILNPFTTKKQTDRYTFDYKPSDPAADSYTFEVTADSPFSIIDKPNTKYKKWLVTGNNWVDFYTESLDADIDITLTDDYTAEVTITKIAATADEIQPIGGRQLGGGNRIAEEQPVSVPNTPLVAFSSIGDLNHASINYTFYTHNITVSYLPIVTELAEQQTWLNITHNQTDGSRTTTAVFVYDGASYPLTNNNATYKVNYLADFVTPAVSSTTDKLGVWYVNVSGESTLFNFTQQVIHMGLSNCSIGTENVSLTLCGVDEVTLANVSSMTLNLDLALWQGSQSVAQNVHFAFRGNKCYSICVSPANTSYQIYSIMEYGDGTDYTDRKYYLYNMTLNTNDPKQVLLYHLNTSLASVITYNIVSQQSGLNVPDAYIKIQRYYPDLNQYLTVEIEKTDQNGKAIAKMVLYNVFYKEYVDYPNGFNRLVTSVAKLVATTRVLAISIGTDLMAGFSEVSNTRVGVGCDRTIGMCNVSWATLDGSARTIKLEIYESTGVSMHLLNTTYSAPASSGQMFMYANPYKNNTDYVAKATIIGSAYPAGTASMNNHVSIFDQAGNEGLRLASLVPLILLTIAIVAALLDFGVVGVVIGAAAGIIIGIITTLIPIDPISIISLILLAGILLYKMVK